VTRGGNGPHERWQPCLPARLGCSKGVSGGNRPLARFALGQLTGLWRGALLGQHLMDAASIVRGPDLLASFLLHGVVEANTPLHVRLAAEGAQQSVPALRTPQGMRVPLTPRKSRLAALTSAVWIRMK
jgi:hypothetical protein